LITNDKQMFVILLLPITPTQTKVNND